MPCPGARPKRVPIGDGIVVLRHVHRYGGAIADLAEAIQRGRCGRRAGRPRTRRTRTSSGSRLDASEPATAGRLRRDPRRCAVESGRTVIEAARAGRRRRRHRRAGRFRLLCAHRRGPEGVAAWTRPCRELAAAEVEGFATGGGLVRRPAADRDRERLRARSSSTATPASWWTAATGGWSAAFERGGAIAQVSPTRLAAVDTVYAMTVHKSQGSQFDTVAFLLPERRLPHPHPRAALHGGDPGPGATDPGRHRGARSGPPSNGRSPGRRVCGGPSGARAADPPHVRAPAAAVPSTRAISRSLGCPRCGKPLVSRQLQPFHSVDSGF